MPKTSTKRLYLIPILSKALDIMELLQAEKSPMALEAIYQRTHFSKTSVYRILKTLVHRGYITQSGDGLYRSVSQPSKLRFGFGSQSSEMPFSEAVVSSLRAAAAASGVDLLILDNRYDGATAIKNADIFVKEQVDLVIEFQVDQHVAPILADKIAGANIPLIAIDIPHPHATYFGVDNYRVGFEAGVLLAEYAQENWSGEVEWILGLDLEEAGTLVQSRMTGAFEGIRSKLGSVPIEKFVRIDGRGMRDKSQRIVSEFLMRHTKDRHILIAAANDTSALGALEAVRELKRMKHVAIVGQDCIPEMLEEIQISDSPVIGSISHEAVQYGSRLIELGMALVRGNSVSPYNYVEHKAVSRDSLVKR
ncbi:MAG: substrate-binding domain-containing protein [Terriglobia bacterium]|nr:substrate-binding domain-containing protein [Terriglobia bacterium]